MKSLKKNILLLEYRFDHELVLGPIYHELKQRDRYHVSRISLTGIYSKLEGMNTWIKNSVLRKKPKENFIPISTPYKKNIVGERRALILGTCCALIFRIFKQVPGVGSKKPDIIVVVNDLTLFGRAAVAAGKLLDIPSLRISASVVGPKQRMPPVSADYLAVSGEAIKEVYVQSGVNPEKITITGDPRFDKLFKRDRQKDRAIIFSKFGIDPARKLVVLTTENIEEEETRKILNAVYLAVKDNNDLYLIVKPHPVEPSLLHHNLLETMGLDNACVVEKADIYELLNAADCVITSFSTTGLEAMMLDRPVISINLTGKPDKMPYAASGAATGVYQEEALNQVLMDALKNNGIRKELKANRINFVNHYNYEIDGKASIRITNLISKIIFD